MTALVLDIHDYLPAMIDPPERRDEPAAVILLPVIRVENAPDGIRQERQTGKSDAQRDDVFGGLPSDCTS